MAEMEKIGCYQTQRSSSLSLVFPDQYTSKKDFADRLVLQFKFYGKFVTDHVTGYNLLGITSNRCLTTNKGDFKCTEQFKIF